MLTFAAPFTPAKARGTGLSLHAACGAGDLGFAPSQPHGGPQAHYWPCESLNAFVLKMAAAGHCVNTAMMLGHRPYALEQLAMARAANDGGLNALAERLQAYFDATAPQGCAVVADIDGA
ncbi:hypothetical protein KW843_03205 [Acidovorax sp. sif1233]|uniref:hypothetical protein n=1 Tax=unclassified Acidovorax TaxID=2684926 RepID=UPI001C455041|nr:MULTISPECIES: hypothetical protein [unclassified Acidovorax]MBV7430927.1 hypothetical protein [Acidovorax sp. sif0732]MBV7452033.1 hypothetical protein [Acidovorax sp. sif0715]MBV7453471.1 hypothetical protein [Acidovorax sp. sif1233]